MQSARSCLRCDSRPKCISANALGMPKSIAIAIEEYFFEKFNCQLSMLFYLRAFPLTINLSWSAAAAAASDSRLFDTQFENVRSPNGVRGQ